MSVGAPLDLPAVFRWCREKFAADPEVVLFETGHLSQVLGLRLTDGRALVVKVRPWQQRLIACGQVQEHLHSKGFPAPQVLVSPTQQGDFAISAETLVNGGELLETDSGSAAQFAEALHLLVQRGSPGGIGELTGPVPGMGGLGSQGDAAVARPG